MKTMLIISVVVVMAIAMIGCAPTAQQAGTDLSALQEQLDQISDDISSLRSDVEGLKGAQTAQPEPGAPAQSEAPTETQTIDNAAASAPGTQETTQKSAADYDISSLTDKVNALVGKMESATEQAMFDVKAEAKKLENEIDAMDDRAKIDYRKGTLSRSDYRYIDGELDQLEDRLDHAEDAMERRLGYDD